MSKYIKGDTIVDERGREWTVERQGLEWDDTDSYEVVSEEGEAGEFKVSK